MGASSATWVAVVLVLVASTLRAGSVYECTPEHLARSNAGRKRSFAPYAVETGAP